MAKTKDDEASEDDEAPHRAAVQNNTTCRISTRLQVHFFRRSHGLESKIIVLSQR